MLSRGVRSIGRATQGVRLIEMEEGDQVVSVAKLAEREEEENGGSEQGGPSGESGNPSDVPPPERPPQE
jgi:DNA gyrase subunit A